MICDLNEQRVREAAETWRGINPTIRRILTQKKAGTGSIEGAEAVKRSGDRPLKPEWAVAVYRQTLPSIS